MEQATKAAVATLTVDQAKLLKPGAVFKPLGGTYLDLKLLVGTFYGLLCTLFRLGCDYYHKLKYLHRTLCSRDVAEIWEAFTIDNCQHIIWAIIDDGPSFFPQKMTVGDFSDPDGYKLPALLLGSIHKEACTFELTEHCLLCV